MGRESFNQFKRKISNLEEFSEGWRGKIYIGYLDGQKVAIKTPKSEEFINAINKEAEFLKILNQHNIGSKLIYHGRDFFIYHFIEGNPLKQVLSEENYKSIIYQLLQQGRILDRLKISKDEMHRPHTNVLVDKKGKVYLIDFERAKYSEKPQNITQILQFILSISNKYFPFIEREELIKLAKEYKREQTEERFFNILKYLNL